MCLPSPPKPPAPPPTPARPATEVNMNSINRMKKAPKSVQTNTSANVKYSKKRGKAALRIPLQVGVGSSGTGANVPQ